MLGTDRLAFGASLLIATGLVGCGGGNGGAPPETRRTFSVPHVLETSGRCAAVTTGDVDGDGVLDLLTLRDGPSCVCIQLAAGARATSGDGALLRGSAAYGPASEIVYVWDTSTDLVVADVTGDGCPDLIVAGGSAHAVGVWPGDALHPGELLSPTIVDTTVEATCVGVGDLDGDGRADLTILDESTGETRAFHRSPSPQLAFSPGPIVGPGFPSHGLVLADLDRDGGLDFVTKSTTGDFVLVTYFGPGGVALIRQSIDVPFPSGRALGVGDVDGDGWLDLVCCSLDGASLCCLRQSSTKPGLFDPVVTPVSIAIKEQGVRVSEFAIKEQGIRFAQALDGGTAVGNAGRRALDRCADGTCRTTFTQGGLGLVDLDRDGVLDVLASPRDPASGPFVLYFGSASSPGAFDAKGETPSGGPARVGEPGDAVCVADLDGDGRFDLTCTLPAGTGLRVHYLDDDGAPPAAFAPTVSLELTGAVVSCAADFDRDGLLDLACAVSNGVYVCFQDAANPGTYLPGVPAVQAFDVRSVAAADMDGDGCPDLVLGTAQPITCQIARRSPTSPRVFEKPSITPIVLSSPIGALAAAVCVAPVDLDGDGRLDVVLVARDDAASAVVRLLGDGNGSLPPAGMNEVPIGAGGWVWVTAGDLDGDGRCDLAACADAPDACAIVLQSPTTPLDWSAPQALALVGGVHVAHGDVDGDGRADLVTCGGGGVRVTLQDRLVRGRFLPSFALSNDACGGLALRDMDGDGRLDACFVESARGRVIIDSCDDALRTAPLSLNGLPPGVPWGAFTVLDADCDGDGRCDVGFTFPNLGGVGSTFVAFTRAP